VAECAFGAEISEDRSSCAVAKAWRLADGRIAVKVVWRGSPVVAPDVVDALYMSDDPVATAVDPKSQSATLCAKLAERGVPVRRLGPEDVAVAHGEFMDLVGSGRLKHFEQAELTAAVRGAQARPLAGALALERRKVGVDQSPLTSSEFAVWVLQRWEETSSPGVYAV
jgi:hypothetical protein